MTILEEHIKKIKELQQKFDEAMKESFREVIEEKFRTNPNLFLITWLQYTPSFNDGDPCYFRVGAVSEVEFHPEKLEGLPKDQSGKTPPLSEYKVYKRVKHEELDCWELFNGEYSKFLTEEISEEEEQRMIELLAGAYPQVDSDLGRLFRLISTYLEETFQNARVYIGRDLQVHVEEYDTA